jgi:hypothetical protein
MDAREIQLERQRQRREEMNALIDEIRLELYLVDNVVLHQKLIECQNYLKKHNGNKLLRLDSTDDMKPCPIIDDDELSHLEAMETAFIHRDVFDPDSNILDRRAAIRFYIRTMTYDFFLDYVAAMMPVKTGRMRRAKPLLNEKLIPELQQRFEVQLKRLLLMVKHFHDGYFFYMNEMNTTGYDLALEIAEESGRNAIYVVKILNQLKNLFPFILNNRMYNDDTLDKMERYTVILVHLDWRL